jgi:spore germination cell wall hydrolase CwlJ-like protein
MTFAFPAISAITTRVIFLTVASAFLLAAGDASTTPTEPSNTVTTDSILAPMTAAEASAASAALAASLPAGTAAIVSEPAEPADEAATVAAPAYRNLSKLVSAMGATTDVSQDAELRCLATAVYFESRGEPLEGQLAVAQAIVNRVESGRYASSICGVVKQRGQFSFDHSRTPAAGRDWQTAQGVARVAVDDMWHEVAPRAVSFHAARLSPGWRGKTRIAQIGNHVFYR